MEPLILSWKLLKNTCFDYMQVLKNLQSEMYYQVSLDSLVSPDNFYQKLEKAIDLHFPYAQAIPYYKAEGQESIDFVVFSR